MEVRDYGRNCRALLKVYFVHFTTAFIYFLYHSYRIGEIPHFFE